MNTCDCDSVIAHKMNIKKLIAKTRVSPVMLFVGFLIVILGVFGLYRIITAKPDYVVIRMKGSPGNWWWVTPRPPDWLVQSIKVGDKEYNSLNKPTAEVLRVNIYDAGGSTKDIYLDVKLSATKNSRTNKYRYKGQTLEIGGPITLSLNNTFLPGIVIAVDETGKFTKNYEERIIQIKTLNRWPWEYDSIVIGETMDDGSGNTIATILDKQQLPAEKEGMTNSGQIVKTFSPVKSDFVITLKIKTENLNNQLVFREEQYIKIGNGVWVQFPSYNINEGLIISIKNPSESNDIPTNK